MMFPVDPANAKYYLSRLDKPVLNAQQSDKVAELEKIKEQLKSGTYTVNLESLAKSISQSGTLGSL